MILVNEQRINLILFNWLSSDLSCL